ncbi:DUF6152 family protein [Elongatibacter sediminis]|uniref:DUF6152 family protein n=1 Tax=Elongatibacter sediminis TaxID=3119006 RepID=A0AAW9RCP7_9GAMM
MNKRILFSLAAFGFIVSTNAWAHHSFPATYMVSEEIEIEGTLVAFMFRNPHAFVHVNVKDENGEVTRYAVEWGGASALGRQGVTRATFKAGDAVRIWGNPGRNPEDHRLRMQRIERTADGYRWGFKEDEVFD